ncbi:MAG: creatininase family protein [bacterium]|nr:creatininase family protein [bacterium]
MPVKRFDEMTWEEARGLKGGAAIGVLPIGAVEAHGPHLPLATDRIIALAMAESGAGLLSEAGRSVVLLPALAYTSALFAAGFPGTLSVRPGAVTELIVDIGSSLRHGGIRTLAIANAHLDPTHLASIHEAVRQLEAEGVVLAFPDLTRKPWAPRLTEEFRSGACHAGRFEGSVVMAARPDLVREDIQRELAANPASLSVAIGEGKRSFEEAQGPKAYFGDPAAATAAEGRETIAVLGSILRDAVIAAEAGSS